MKTLSNDIKAEAKGVKAFATCTNSFKHPRVRFCFNQHGGGVIRVKSGKGRATNEVKFEDKIVAKCTCLKKMFCLKFLVIPRQKSLKACPSFFMHSHSTSSLGKTMLTPLKQRQEYVLNNHIKRVSSKPV